MYCLFWAGGASAAKPITDRYEQILTGLEVGLCPDDSWVLEDSTLRITERFFFDKAGNLTRIQVKGEVVEARLDIEGKGSIPEVVHFNYTFYPDDGTLISRGLVSRVNVPGAGHVLLDAGRLVWDGMVRWYLRPVTISM